MIEAARSRRDDARYEPEVATAGREGASDPLAELARLVGQEDPFRRVFRPGASADDPRVARGAPPPTGGGAGEPHAPRYAEEHAGYDAPHGDDPHGHAADPSSWHEPHPDDPEGYDAHEAYDERYYAVEQDVHPDEAGIADEHFATDAAAAATLPDLWARDGENGYGEAPAVDHGRSASEVGAGERSSARRPLAVLAAVLVLTGGGLAASFLAKGPAAPGAPTAASSRGAPTIMAATGPTKVKVEDPAATAPEDQDAALLNKNGAASSGPVKIVSSEEQPADLSLLPKPSDLAAGARPLPPAAPSPFPEPRKVKTFVVHPDGTMLSADGVPASPDATASAVPGPASADALGAAQPATPKTASRGGATTPRSAPPSAPAAPLAADAAPADAAAAAPRQPASPGVHVASAKPVEPAEASATGYGLQLVSLPSESEAQASIAKLKKKYPSLLGSLAATVHKAETGDKPVYRVRVGGMSQDEAKALCTRLQGAGGSCLVVRN